MLRCYAAVLSRKGVRTISASIKSLLSGNKNSLPLCILNKKAAPVLKLNI